MQSKRNLWVSFLYYDIKQTYQLNGSRIISPEDIHASLSIPASIDDNMKMPLSPLEGKMAYFMKIMSLNVPPILYRSTESFSLDGNNKVELYTDGIYHGVFKQDEDHKEAFQLGIIPTHFEAVAKKNNADLRYDLILVEGYGVVMNFLSIEKQLEHLKAEDITNSL